MNLKVPLTVHNSFALNGRSGVPRERIRASIANTAATSPMPAPTLAAMRLLTPEPSSMSLCTLGLAALALIRFPAFPVLRFAQSLNSHGDGPQSRSLIHHKGAPDEKCRRRPARRTQAAR